ncbi:uncharacterized protein LOC143550093 [Bidens hawaiensis]|uniref:uncharacterized protein LOC143550093 n=1 Tax=Bidens hawaiensis TaxID=980011 RepID=UPI00404A59B6
MAEDKEVGPVREQGNVSLQCPKLTETNYTVWAILMEQILKAYGLWGMVSKTEEEDDKKVATTKAMIFQTLPEDILMQVAQYPSAKEVWESINVRYVGEDRVQKARLSTLRNELDMLKMKENETVNEFASNLTSIRAKFRTLGSNLKDKVIVRKLINSVPKKFLPIIAPMEQYSDIDSMSFEEAVGRIKTFEERLKALYELEENDQSKLLLRSSSNPRVDDLESWHYGKRRGGDQNRGRGRGFDRGERGRGRGMGQGNKDKSGFRCYECGELGHFAYECTKWEEKKDDKNEQANLVRDDHDPALW